MSPTSEGRPASGGPVDVIVPTPIVPTTCHVFSMPWRLKRTVTSGCWCSISRRTPGRTATPSDRLDDPRIAHIVDDRPREEPRPQRRDQGVESAGPRVHRRRLLARSQVARTLTRDARGG